MDGGVNWTAVITSALGMASTLGAVFMGPRLGLSKDRKLRQDELDRSARYLAIRVICVLDPFISRCCEVVDDDGEDDRDGITHTRVEDPRLSLPDDVDWKSISPDLMYHVLSLPNELEIAEQTASFIAKEVAGPPDYGEAFGERISQYGQLGLKAFALAAAFRRTYEISERDFGNRNPKDRLQSALTRLDAERERSRAENAEMSRDMAAKWHQPPTTG